MGGDDELRIRKMRLQQLAELVTVTGIDPQSPIARHVGRIRSLRDDPFEPELAHLGMECRATSDLMIAVFERRTDAIQKRGRGAPSAWSAAARLDPRHPGIIGRTGKK